MAWTLTDLPPKPVLLLIELPRPPQIDVGDMLVIHTDFAALDAPLLARYRPEHIACPLVADQFDAVQLALRLSQLGYSGWLTVIGPALPDRRMVAAELAAAAPGMRIAITTG